jgi:hypothetical protein
MTNEQTGDSPYPYSPTSILVVCMHSGSCDAYVRVDNRGEGLIIVPVFVFLLASSSTQPRVPSGRDIACFSTKERGKETLRTDLARSRRREEGKTPGQWRVAEPCGAGGLAINGIPAEG